MSLVRRVGSPPAAGTEKICVFTLAKAPSWRFITPVTAIPGVGKKTAERMCVELRDRMPKAIAASDLAASPGDALRDDLVSALINLGYHRQAIDKSLDKLVTPAGDQRFEDVLRAALKDLSRA